MDYYEIISAIIFSSSHANKNSHDKRRNNVVNCITCLYGLVKENVNEWSTTFLLLGARNVK